MAVERKMQKTIIGFVPYQSPIYLLHPLVRFVIFLVTGFIPLFVEVPEINILFLAAIFGLFIYSRVDLKKLKIYLPMIFTVGVFLLVTYVFFPVAKGEKILIYQFGIVKIYYNSIIWAICVYFRIIALVYASIFYFSTNRERDILVAFRSLGMPFIATYFLGLSLRSAGIFMEDYQIIREAEQARGLDVSDLSFIDKIKHFSMYIIPLFTLSIRRCEEISVGLYSKGTVISNKVEGLKRPDYLMSKNPVTKKDIAYASIIVALFLIFCSLQVFWGAFSLSHSPLNIAMLKLLKGG